MKKFRLLLIVLLVLSVSWIMGVGFPVNPVRAAAISDFTYEPGFGDLIITGYQGIDTVLEIPEYIEGWPVVGIADRAFSDDDLINEVIIHAGWGYRIGDCAFADCDRLTNLTIHCGGAGFSIGDSAFRDCDVLMDVTLPIPDMLEIGPSAFRGCDSLTSIKLPAYPESETFLHDYAFADCQALKKVLYPAPGYGSVRIIGVGVFDNSDGLEKFIIRGRNMFLSSLLFMKS